MRIGSWRLLDTGHKCGADNMAIDEALLACYQKPVFRVYGWSPPCLSVGRYQDLREVFRTGDISCHLVRRMTGGGVIYHKNEITYSLVCGLDRTEGLPLRESYKKLSGFLLEFYRSLGLDAVYALDCKPDAGESYGKRADLCFSGKENYDIIISGKKIGGNAQRVFRREGLIFQHGSIPIELEWDGVLDLLTNIPEGIGGKTTSLKELGAGTKHEVLKSQLIDAFRKYYACVMEYGGLTAEELKTASLLLNDKYRNNEWNFNPGRST